MTDERLTRALTTWLQDSDASAPDTPMSASRVMAGIEVTAQLGRAWPPIRLAPAVEPAPALGAFGPEGPPPRPARLPREPRFVGVRSKATPVRVLSVAVVVAFVGSVVMLGASLMPNSAAPEPAPAAAAIEASPTAVPQPTAAATPVPTATPAAPAPTAAPWPTWPPTDRAIDWHGGGVRMEADALRLRIGEKVFRARGEVLSEGATHRDHAELKSYWHEPDVEQRMVIDLELDGDEWWIREIKTYDGRKSGDWVEFGGLGRQTRTPLGETIEADLQLKSTGAGRRALRKAGAATLRLDGLRLTAFGPGTRTAPLTGCTYYEDPRIEKEGRSGAPLQGDGEPLHDVGARTPAEVEAVLRGLGLCYRFDYQWAAPSRSEDSRLNRHFEMGFERRCSAPPTGEVVDIEFLPTALSVSDGATIMVNVLDGEVRDWPEPPPAGTDCPSL